MTTPSSERVVPGSHNLPPATWPPTARTPSASIDAPAIAAQLIASLNDALANKDAAAVAELFVPDDADDKPAASGNETDNEEGVTGFWRDHLVLSWRLRTVKGREGIRAFVEAGFGDGGGGAERVRFEVDGSSEFRRPNVVDFRPVGGAKGVMFFVKVENGAVGGVGRGIVKVAEVEAGVWKLWTVFTTLEGVKGAEEKRGEGRERGVEHGGLEGRKNWKERRRDESEFVEANPEVLIVGECCLWRVFSRRSCCADCNQGLASPA